MKKISFQEIFNFSCLLVLSFTIYKVIHLEEILQGLARPSRLFNPTILISKFDNKPEWEVDISPDHARFFHIITQQQLNWLGKGAQATAFETQDGKYVVKFFQIGKIKKSSDEGFVRTFFSKKKREKQEYRIHQREEMFSSSKMCYENLSKETGIIYVHLNKTADLIKGVKLVDRYGQSHRIRGDEACFVVQKKARYVISTLSHLMDKNDFEGAKLRLDQIFDVVLSLTKKGFIDGDDALIRNNNIGFCDDGAIIIDTGHIYRADNINIIDRMKYEFNIRLKPLQQWLNVVYPTLGSYYTLKQHEIMAALKQQEEKSKMTSIVEK